MSKEQVNLEEFKSNVGKEEKRIKR